MIEDEIRLDCDMIATANGATTFDDTQAAKIINSGAANGGGAPFNFISDRSSGFITDTNSTIQQSNPDVPQSQVPTALSYFNQVKSQAGLNQVFRVILKDLLLSIRLSTNNNKVKVVKTPFSNTVSGNTDVNMLINRIQQKSGQQLAVADFITTGANNIKAIQLPINQTVDIFKTTSDLQDKISQRQKVLKSFYSTLKNEAELKSLDSSRSTSSQLVTPGGFGNSNVPEVFEHMIEDETYDDYGPGSGTRYIIRRPQIRSINIAANAPPYTTVEVQGILDPFLANPSNLPGALNFFPVAATVWLPLWPSIMICGGTTVSKDSPPFRFHS